MSAPPSVGRQVEEIVAERDRAAAYARLLHLQRACADDPSSAADLAAASPSALLPLLLRDAADHEEAVAASALKCLGFALYHPVLVSTISGQMAQLVLDTLVQLITTTKMKAICNLGVWCISTQQMEALTIEDRVTPLLTAIVYALDNPFGSLSTTFEAAQATMKLASQNPKRMRDLSSIWVPSIYRRLLSADKPEMDMAERCLFKVSPVILPPHSLLSKYSDCLLTAVEELNISRMFGPAMAERRIVTANSTERIKTNGESLRISAGVGRKRLKVTKYSSKAKEPDRNSEGVSSPHFVEGKVCRKPELILELLKRKI